ncbi:hypothetical protein ACIBTZ_33945 [Micromonospora sp. NPDC049460]|uniref:hypothetical protein n=1 Tax=Micromonospora sp. NPDC049460 TaxID=3364272 RepID=UPI0037A58C7F
MAFGHRWLVRTAAAALLLLAGMATPAGPASAADPGAKFTLDLPGTTIPLGVEKKRVHLRLTNLTDQTPREIIFYVRPSELDWSYKAALIWSEGGGSGECDGDHSGWYCRIESSLFPELMPAPGGTVDLPIDIQVYEKKKPYEGRFHVEAGMAWGDDKMQLSASKWFTLTLVDDPEADLSVVAPDVKQSVRVGADGRLESTGTLNPGETGAVRYRVVNQGRKAVSGVKATLHLPKGVTFTRPPKECAVGDDGRSAVCTYDTLALVPAGQDTDPNDSIYSAVELHNLVTASASITAPVTLAGGTVQVEGLTERTDARSGPEHAELPANAVAVRAADVDGSDNEDGFAVVVAASGSGGDGGDDGGSGGGGGDLPITGPQSGLIAGAGLAMVAGGGIMLLLARRRRAVAMVRGDETPAV